MTVLIIIIREVFLFKNKHDSSIDEIVKRSFFCVVVDHEDAWKETLKTRFRFKPQMVAMFNESGYDVEEEWSDMTNDDLAELGVIRGYLKRWRKYYPAPESTSVIKRINSEISKLLFFFFFFSNSTEIIFGKIKLTIPEIGVVTDCGSESLSLPEIAKILDI